MDDRAGSTGLIFGTADWLSQICESPQQPHLRPARRTRRSVGTLDDSPPVSLPVGEHGTLRHEALFKEAPQRDRQFTRNRNDHDPSDTPALPCGSLHKPPGDCTLWLVLEPEPSRLDHGPAHLASPRSRDPLGSLHVHHCREDSLQDRESRLPAAGCRIGDSRPRVS